MDKKVFETIDSCIKQVWCYDIKSDYNADRILQEDTMKNALYFHLRTKLGDTFLEEHNLKLYTEFHDGILKSSNMRPDIVIVEMKYNYQKSETEYLGDPNNFEAIPIVIELKFQGNTSTAENNVYRDFDKINEYMKILPEDTKYYLGIIHEKYWSKEERCWADPAGYKYPKGKVTELAASYDENDEMMFEVFEL